MDDYIVTHRAIDEAARESVTLPYRLVLLRQYEHEKAGRYELANECAAIRHCLEIAHNKSLQRSQKSLAA